MTSSFFVLYLGLAFIIGIGLGVLVYGFYNANFARSLKVKNKLTETELELTHVKDALADNLLRTTKAIDTIQKQLFELEEKISEDKKLFLEGNEQAFYKLESQNKAQENKDFQGLEIPKDYSD